MSESLKESLIDHRDYSDEAAPQSEGCCGACWHCLRACFSSNPSTMDRNSFHIELPYEPEAAPEAVDSSSYHSFTCTEDAIPPRPAGAHPSNGSVQLPSVLPHDEVSRPRISRNTETISAAEISAALSSSGESHHGSQDQAGSQDLWASHERPQAAAAPEETNETATDTPAWVDSEIITRVSRCTLEKMEGFKVSTEALPEEPPPPEEHKEPAPVVQSGKGGPPVAAGKGKGKGKGKQLQAKYEHHTQVKTLFWEKLNSSATGNSVWDQFGHEQVEELENASTRAEVEALFGVKSQRTSKKQEPPKGGFLLSRDRLQQVGIVMARHFKGMAPEQIVAHFEDDSLEFFTGDRIEGLRCCLPSRDEVAKLNAYKGAVSELCPMEQLMRLIGAVPDVNSRVGALYLCDQMDLPQIEKVLDLYMGGAKQLMDARAFQEVLHVILVVGNQLNDGKAFQATGFQLSSLSKLQMVPVTAKGRPVETLLDYIISKVDVVDSTLHSFADEMKDLLHVCEPDLFEAHLDKLQAELETRMAHFLSRPLEQSSKFDQALRARMQDCGNQVAQLITKRQEVYGIVAETLSFYGEVCPTNVSTRMSHFCKFAHHVQTFCATYDKRQKVVSPTRSALSRSEKGIEVEPENTGNYRRATL